MVHVVHAGNRSLHRTGLSQMYCDRKRIFHDALRWNIPVSAGIFEIDQFDNDGAVYLLDLAEDEDRHLGSARLLPTTEPHILGSLFSALCDRPVPRGPEIWEITRWCNTPRMRREDAMRSRQRLGVALAEFAIQYGVGHYTCVAELPWIQKLQAIGWQSALLGTPREINGEMLAALKIDVGPETLRDFRLRTGYRTAILQIRGARLPIRDFNFLEAGNVA
jgi:acyl-homoserine lactone synthase